MDRLLQVVVDVGGVEIEQQRLPFVFRQHRHLLQHRVVITGHRLQQPLQVTEVTHDRRFVEQRRGVLQRAAKLALRLAQGQRQVELGEVAGLGDAFERQVVEDQAFALTALPTEQGLEQRAVGQAALRLDDVHHLLERQVLVGLGFQRAGLDLGQQRFGAQLARGVDAQRQGVDEHADQAFDLGPATVGHRRADHHVRLAGQARHQHRPRARQSHVQRHAVALAQRVEAGGQAFIQGDFDLAAGVVLLRRPRPVGGQGQQSRRAAQGLAPVVALALQHLAAEPAALPHGVVGVLQGQRRQRIGLAVAEGLVKRHQLAGQHAHGPTVGDDVVQGQQQDVVIIGHAHQPSADQRIALQVERGRRFALDQRQQRVFGLRVAAQVFSLQRQAAVHRGDQHLGFVIELGEAAAQGFVAGDNPRQ